MACDIHKKYREDTFKKVKGGGGGYSGKICPCKNALIAGRSRKTGQRPAGGKTSRSRLKIRRCYGKGGYPVRRNHRGEKEMPSRGYIRNALFQKREDLNWKRRPGGGGFSLNDDGILLGPPTLFGREYTMDIVGETWRHP